MRIEPFRMERLQSTWENYVEYNLSESGVHPMRVSELLAASERAGLLDTELGYVQSNGTEELRDRIAAFYPDTTRDEVLVTNGGSEANYATFWALLEKGDRVACMVPNYMQTWGLSRAFGRAVDPFRLVRRRAGGTTRWTLDVDGLRRAVTRRTRVVLVTHPNNPTGALLTEEEMDEIVRVTRRAGATLVVDEIYRGAELSGRTTPTFRGRTDRVVITSGLSKAFGLPGLRIGWVVAPKALVARLWSYRDYTTIAPGALSERLARTALEPAKREAIFARTRRIIRANWPIVESWLASHDRLFDFVPPEAGAIVLARYALPVSSGTLVDRLRREKSVLVVPGDLVGAPRHLRIGFGSDPEYLRRGLARIDELLEAVRGGRPAGRRASLKSTDIGTPERRAARGPSRD